MANEIQFYIAQHETKRTVPVTTEVLQQALDLDYNMLTTPITTVEYRTSVLSRLSDRLAELDGEKTADEGLAPLIPPLKPSDTNLMPNELVSQLLVHSSTWIDLASPDPIIANVSRQVFNQEVAFAAFCGATNLVVQAPKLHHGSLHGAGVAQFARAVKEALTIGPYLTFHIMFPMTDDPATDSGEGFGHLSRFARSNYVETDEGAGKEDPFGTWDAWNIIRTICQYHVRLTVGLSLPRQLPSVHVQTRWFSEPLRILLIPGNAFIHNRKGQPVLPKPHQSLISRYMRLRIAPWVILSDVGPLPGFDILRDGLDVPRSPNDMTIDDPTPTEAAHLSSASAGIRTSTRVTNDPTPHLSYLRYFQRNQPPKPTIEQFGSGYQDYLQVPLQPLTDNLESITYEVFEKDPIKYEWYERAVAQGLRDWVAQGKSTSGPDRKPLVAVAGAGRGPLVTRALQASISTGVPISLWAVEKNPNAYVVLQHHNATIWNGAVTVVKTDMRAWKGPTLPDGTHAHVDILISELLGSFADNELSPECLDGVQHVLNPVHGISIPRSYSAYLTPIAAPKLHADIRAREPTDPTAPETPYVVMLHAFDYLSYTVASESSTSTAGEGKPASPSPSPESPSPHNSPIIPTAPLHPSIQPTVPPCWTFTHPLPATHLAHSALRRSGLPAGGTGGSTGGSGWNEHNARGSRMTFAVPERGVCHGLAAYFEAELYPGTELSTHPGTMAAKSGEMVSWFPMFFPLKTPMYLPAGSELQISMHRQTDDLKVWYEWFVEAFVEVGGTRLRIGTSALHSSKKNGCVL
ncbi:Skb1 methyltransferase [Eremomyces bilateralis CBS 781.70]|uniref:Protein arginine N-methyltransferase n=1 Tax=Eremomyces bilateralis CBS 781.70 TaxID=1392243 RepID=A0A6G1GH50_9PEZI|nr:Skb1 methyltransferase [Eremomyces bilateralis CBS 781.70]KAF1817199.1 Skb1 methyltransferase [Eremomyces bilateralis CBS 781.70]